MLTWMKVGDVIGNMMVKVMGGGNNKTFILDVVCPGKKTRYFSTLQALLDHFQVCFGKKKKTSGCVCALWSLVSKRLRMKA